MILKSLQSAYKLHHSCGTSLVQLQNDILRSIDDDHCVVMLLLDLLGRVWLHRSTLGKTETGETDRMHG